MRQRERERQVQGDVAHGDTRQVRRKQLSVGPACKDERVKRPLGCLGHAPGNYIWISDILRSFLVQSGGEIA